jgi:hypothetical protein
MVKEIEIEMEGVVIVGTLMDGDEWGQAPKACDAFLKTLPINAKAMHGMWSGNIVVVESAKIPEVEPENPTIFLSQGDIGIVPNRYGRKVGELIIAYGRRVSMRGTHTGKEPVNVFAEVKDIDSMEKFAEVCRRTRLEGLKEINIRLREQH